MNGSIGTYTGSGLTNKPSTLNQYMESESARENLFKLLKEASISGNEEKNGSQTPDGTKSN